MEALKNQLKQIVAIKTNAEMQCNQKALIKGYYSHPINSKKTIKRIKNSINISI